MSIFICWDSEVGLSFISDHSGKVFKRKGAAACTLKDVAANREVARFEDFNVIKS